MSKRNQRGLDGAVVLRLRRYGLGSPPLSSAASALGTLDGGEVLAGRGRVAPGSSFGRTTSTGQGASLTTASEQDPNHNLERPRRPCVPTMTRSAPTFAAKLQIS